MSAAINTVVMIHDVAGHPRAHVYRFLSLRYYLD